MIHPTLFRKELQEHRFQFLAALLITVATAFFLTLRADSVSLYLLKSGCFQYPGFNSLPTTYEHHLWSLWQAKTLTFLSGLSAVVLGFSVLGGEAARGTHYFLLGKPVSGREIYTTKAAAGVSMLAAVVFIPTLLLLIQSVISGRSISTGAFFTAAFIVFTGAAVIYLTTLLFSALIKQPLISLTAATLFWLAVAVPGCWVHTARYSFFYQMGGVPYWIYGGDPLVPLGLFLVAAGLLYELGVYIWSSREL